MIFHKKESLLFLIRLYSSLTKEDTNLSVVYIDTHNSWLAHSEYHDKSLWLTYAIDM